MHINLNPKAIAALSSLTKEEIHHVADAIATDASSRAPRHSGRLADSIHAIPDPDQHDAYRVVMEWYGIFPEFGTVRQPAQPFMRPAADAAR